MPKINLTLIKKLIDALEKSQNICEDMKTREDDSEVYDYSIEMSRSYGICVGIMQEGALLAADVQDLLKLSTTSVAPDKANVTANYLQTLMSEIKGNNGGKGGKN